jgi:hypothetical protein
MAGIAPYLLLGALAGVFSGLIGVGGGVIIVPALVYLFGMSMHQAQGTTLAMLVPPVGLLAAWTYYRQGYVELSVAALLCAGFVVGAWGGARLATNLSNVALERTFGVVLVMIGLKMVIGGRG